MSPQLPWLALSVLCAAGCSGGGLSDARAEKLVRLYNAQVIEAYRTADASGVASIASADELRRLTVLIDVNLDMCINLDAQLLSLQVEKVERVGAEVLVTTSERWRSVERATGTGAQVGPTGEDEYFIQYRLADRDGAWIVVQTRHAAAPVRSHPEAFGAGSVEVFHGVEQQGPLDAGGPP